MISLYVLDCTSSAARRRRFLSSSLRQNSVARCRPLRALCNTHYEGLSVHREEIHDYLVIDIDCREQGKVKVSMIKYLACVLQELPEHLGMTAVTPAAGHLFKVHNYREKQYMIKYQAQNFHHIVSQLFLISARTR